jgi:hypothetical protein
MTAALEGGEWSAARPGHTLPPGKTRYPLYMRLGGPQGRSGRAENLVPTGIRSRTVQPGSSVAIPTELPGPQLREILSHKDPVPIVQEAVQHVAVLHTAGNCNTVVCIVILYYNSMGPPSYMRSVVDRNVVMRRITVFCSTFLFTHCEHQ